jgi:hypothetical protein
MARRGGRTTSGGDYMPDVSGRSSTMPLAGSPLETKAEITGETGSQRNKSKELG